MASKYNRSNIQMRISQMTGDEVLNKGGDVEKLVYRLLIGRACIGILGSSIIYRAS